MSEQQLLTGSALRGPLTADEREYYRHVASFNAITQGDRLTVQPCRDVLALDDALREANERAEKFKAALEGFAQYCIKPECVCWACKALASTDR